MSTPTEVAAAHHESEVGEEARVRRNRLGLWIFFFSEIFLFGAIFASRFYLWGGTRPDLDQFVGLLATAVLLISSFFMARAETAVAHGDRREFLRDLLITAFLGALFLFGVVGVEWQGHLRPSDGVFGAIFFGMTGLHALHVASGVFLILVVWWNGRKGAYTPEKHWPVEATAIYWHYVDVVWVFFYPALYLIGEAV
jgi:cytochrome c oxidase subunit 3